jgi:Bacterial type II and III secretion system protein
MTFDFTAESNDSRSAGHNMAFSRSVTSVLLACLAMALPSPVFAQGSAPQQVIVSVKIIEFQTSKGVETGLSAYFVNTPRTAPEGEVITSGKAINNLDLTFPTSTAAGITVFLDRISINDGDLEMVLQALVNENRAYILSRPRAMVKIKEATPTIVQTTNKIPYENTQVVGSTTVQITSFQNTGVTLNITAPDITDDDGNWNTTDDTYIQLKLTTEVKEEGQRIVIALDDQLAGGGDFSLARNAISVPEFVSRSIDTSVWVRDGQVLILGGLYRNIESKNLATVPWLTQGEDFVTGAMENLIPGNSFASPLSSTLGNRSTSESRRELVFLIKTEIWRPSFSIDDDLGFAEQKKKETPDPPADVVTEITDIPKEDPPGEK